jgi:3alpha(or 20beta)-hydroxysteroid dehydrogenase
MNRLHGKVAIVTGAAQGLGASIARDMVAEGAQVILADVQDQAGEALARELGRSARFVHLDVRDRAGWQAAVSQAEAAFGAVSILVNNAVKMEGQSFDDLTEQEFREVFEVNELGCFLGMKAVIASMESRGGGSIVNISSIAGMQPASGIRGMSKSVAHAVASRNIRVNSVHPGWMRTPSSEVAPLDRVAPLLPLKKIGETAEVAKLITFLASDDASLITGSEYLIDGGALLMGNQDLILSIMNQ